MVNPSKFLIVFALSGLFGPAPVWLHAQATAEPAAAPAQKQWKDRNEFDLFEAARTGKDPKANIEKLNQWKQQYPETQFLKERRQLYLTNYVAAQDISNVIATAKETLATDPDDFTSLYYITLYTAARVPAGATSVPPEILDDGEKAATGMLANLDKQKPATMAADQWETTKKGIAAVAHTTLGWVDMQRKAYEKAEAEFKQSLALNPANGDVTYWLGIVEAGQKKPEEKGPELLFYFARAASYDGPGAASPGIRQAAGAYLDKAYVQFHGSNEGLDKLKALAKTNATPPVDYKLVSVVEIEKSKVEKENQFAQEHPDLAIFKQIKDALTGADAQSYYDQNLKGAQLPKLKGKVISMTPAANPKTVVLGVMDDKTPEVTLHFDAALPGKVDEGTELSFIGVPESFTSSPFMLNVKVEKENLEGWTGKAAPPVRRRTTPKK